MLALVYFTRFLRTITNPSTAKGTTIATMAKMYAVSAERANCGLLLGLAEGEGVAVSCGEGVRT